VTATNSVGSSTSSASSSITLSAPPAPSSGWNPAAQTCGSGQCTFAQSNLIYGASVAGVEGAKAAVQASGGTVNAFTLYFGSYANFFLLGANKNAVEDSGSYGEPYYYA
jgi:hypothetical protein